MGADVDGGHAPGLIVEREPPTRSHADFEDVAAGSHASQVQPVLFLRTFKGGEDPSQEPVPVPDVPQGRGIGTGLGIDRPGSGYPVLIRGVVGLILGNGTLRITDTGLPFPALRLHCQVHSQAYARWQLPFAKWQQYPVGAGVGICAFLWAQVSYIPSRNHRGTSRGTIPANDVNRPVATKRPNKTRRYPVARVRAFW